MPARLVTGPAAEPVTRAEAKAHLRINAAVIDDDAYVDSLITVARAYLEQACWRAFISQVWEITLAGFQGKDRFELTPEWQSPAYVATFAAPTTWLVGAREYRFEPYLALDRGHLANTPALAVTYYDENNVLQTLGSSTYLVQGSQDETRAGKLFLNEVGGYSWPNTAARPDAVKIVATYGWLDAAAVPAPLKHAIKLLVSQLYEQRTPQVTGTIVADMDFTLDALIGPYRFNVI